MKIHLNFPKLRRAQATEFSRPTFQAKVLSATTSGKILSKYTIGPAVVIIADENGKGRYLVGEPPLTPEEQRIYSLLMESLYFSLKPAAKFDDPVKYVEEHIKETAEELAMKDQVMGSFDKFRYYISRDSVGYGLVNIAMEDEAVEEVGCEGFGRPVAIIHKMFTQFDWLDSNMQFQDDEELKRFVQRLAQRSGKTVTTAVPFADMMTEEGHRVALTFGKEVTLPGSSFDIRKFPKKPLSITYLIKSGMLSSLLAAYYWILIENKAFILALGTMGSGKTSITNALATLIRPSMKIATIEDTPEINLPHTHWQRFQSRKSYSISASKFDVDLMDLTVLSMRYRPDYIILGEVRGAEVSALVQAASTGHGSITSFHAEDAKAALVRLRSPPMNVSEGGQMLIWSLLLVGRIKLEGSNEVIRRVLASSEIAATQSGPKLVEIFKYSQRTDSFSPNTAAEVVSRSERLKSLENIAGRTSEEVAADLEAKSKFLDGLVASGKIDQNDVTVEMRRYYSEGT